MNHDRRHETSALTSSPIWDPYFVNSDENGPLHFCTPKKHNDEDSEHLCNKESRNLGKCKVTNNSPPLHSSYSEELHGEKKCSFACFKESENDCDDNAIKCHE